MEIKQNTLYLTLNGAYVSRDHLNLKIEVEHETKLSIPIHHLESVCVFGHEIALSPHALQLCWEHGVAVNYFSEHGYLLGRWEGVPNTSITLRRVQYRAADDPARTVAIARQLVAGKVQNARQNVLRSAREGEESDACRLRECAGEMGKLLAAMQHALNRGEALTLDQIRGYEGQSASLYFDVFKRASRRR